MKMMLKSDKFCIRFTQVGKNGAWEHLKSAKMMPRNVLERILEAILLLFFAQESHKDEIDALFARFQYFWGPVGSQQGAWRGLKSTILAPSRDKSRQNEVQEGVLKKASNFDRILIAKWEAWGAQIIDFTAVLQCYLRIHSFSKKLKIHENLCQNGAQK